MMIAAASVTKNSGGKLVNETEKCAICDKTVEWCDEDRNSKTSNICLTTVCDVLELERPVDDFLNQDENSKEHIIYCEVCQFELKEFEEIRTQIRNLEIRLLEIRELISTRYTKQPTSSSLKRRLYRENEAVSPPNFEAGDEWNADNYAQVDENPSDISAEEPTIQNPKDAKNEELAEYLFQIRKDEKVQNARLRKALDRKSVQIKEKGEDLNKTTQDSTKMECPKLYKSQVLLERIECIKAQSTKLKKKKDNPSNQNAKVECVECKKCYKSQVLFQMHLKRQGGECKRNKNGDDSTKTDQKNSKVECSQCKKFYKSQVLLEGHLKRQGGKCKRKKNGDDSTKTDKNSKVECSQCKKFYKSQVLLEAHLKRQGGECKLRKSKSDSTEIDQNSKVECNECGRYFKNQTSLKTHLDRQGGECKLIPSLPLNSRFDKTQKKIHRYICGVCGHKYRSPHHLKVHINITHMGHRHLCKYCTKGFTTRQTLAKHQRQVHTEEYMNNAFKNGNAEAELDKIKQQTCHICNKHCVTLSSLKQHIERHGEKRFVCEVCGSGYPSSSSLQMHSRIHRENWKKYKCDVCGHGFEREFKKLIHMAAKHGIGERIKIQCELCGKEVGDKFKLKRHYALLHKNPNDGPGEFQCEICNVSCNLRGNLIKHALTDKHQRLVSELGLKDLNSGLKFPEIKNLSNKYRKNVSEILEKALEKKLVFHGAHGKNSEELS